MNYRHLFRGKRLDNGEWVQGHYRSRTMEPNFDRVRHFISMDYPEIYEIDETTLGQCTGLKDKNGRLIFEGDIVSISNEVQQWRNGVAIPYIGEVIWHRDGFWVNTRPGMGFNEMPQGTLLELFDCCEWYGHFDEIEKPINRLVYAGNVHDNPELLGEG